MQKAGVCTAAAWQLCRFLTQLLKASHESEASLRLYFRWSELWHTFEHGRRGGAAWWRNGWVMILIGWLEKGEESKTNKQKRSGSFRCVNGSRKRVLILKLHTQILLYSPSGLCYSTLRRQKAKRLSGFWPRRTLFLLKSGFPLEKVELRLGNASVNCSRGKRPTPTPRRPGVCSRESSQRVTFLLDFCCWLRCFGGKQTVMEVACGDKLWIWILGLFPLDQRFCWSGNILKIPWHIRGDFRWEQAAHFHFLFSFYYFVLSRCRV